MFFDNPSKRSSNQRALRPAGVADDGSGTHEHNEWDVTFTKPSSRGWSVAPHRGTGPFSLDDPTTVKDILEPQDLRTVGSTASTHPSTRSQVAAAIVGSAASNPPEVLKRLATPADARGRASARADRRAQRPRRHLFTPRAGSSRRRH